MIWRYHERIFKNLPVSVELSPRLPKRAWEKGSCAESLCETCCKGVVKTGG